MNKLILLAALAVASTEAAQIAVTNGPTQTLAKGATIAVTGLVSGNHLCWAANAVSAATAPTCSALTKGIATDIGATGCGNTDVASLTWTTAVKYISIIQCSSINADVDAAVALTFTENECTPVKANAAAWATVGCVVGGTQNGATITLLGAQSPATGYTSCAITCPTDGQAFVVAAVKTVTLTDTLALTSQAAGATPNTATYTFQTDVALATGTTLAIVMPNFAGASPTVTVGSCDNGGTEPTFSIAASSSGATYKVTLTTATTAIVVTTDCTVTIGALTNPASSGAPAYTVAVTDGTVGTQAATVPDTVSGAFINFVVTAGAAQTIYKGATVATSGAQTANWLCWAAGTEAGTVTCGAVGTATDFGADGCSNANPSTLTLTWTTVAGTHVAIKECSAVDTAVGVEVDAVFTDKNFVVTAGASQTIEKGAAVAISGVQTANWLCWKAGAVAGDVTCGDVSDKTDIGLTGCSAAAPTSLTWTTLAGIHVAIKECSAASTAAGVEVDIVLTEANIAITGGAAQDLVAGAALVVTELGSGRHLCWTAAATATPITECAVAATANDAGTSGCGAADDASLVWTTVAGTHVSIIQCEGTTKKGSAVATVLTEQIVVASQNITAGSIVTVAGLTTGNHLCWTAGTAAGGATCAAAGTTADLGVTGCGAADDNTIAWTTTSNDYIAIRECTGTNTNVGAEVDLVLGVTTTAAPTPTTTVSGASSEAAWSTMLTVFAIAMAAFSTL